MAKKETCCPHCQKRLRVSERAISVVCPYCHQRVAVEDHIISDYCSVSLVESTGSLRIASNGNLHARVRVNYLEIQGQLHGNVIAQGKVTVEPGGFLEGNVTTPSLQVKPGAKLKGFCRIEPASYSQNPNE